MEKKYKNNQIPKKETEKGKVHFVVGLKNLPETIEDYTKVDL